MKALVIGHSRGIGNAIMEALQAQGHQVQGVGLSNGFDVSLPEKRNEVVNLSLSVDLVINNARAGFHQVETLSEIHSAWLKSKKKGTIINLGSISYIDHLARPDSHELYYHQKGALTSLSRALNLKPHGIKVITINPGHVATERIQKKNLKDTPIIQVDYIVNLILWILSQPENILISEINLSGFDWQST